MQVWGNKMWSSPATWFTIKRMQRVKSWYSYSFPRNGSHRSPPEVKAWIPLPDNFAYYISFGKILEEKKLLRYPSFFIVFPTFWLFSQRHSIGLWNILSRISSIHVIDRSLEYQFYMLFLQWCITSKQKDVQHNL